MAQCVMLVVVICSFSMIVLPMERLGVGEELTKSIQEMQWLYDCTGNDKGTDIRDTFNTVLHLPLLSIPLEEKLYVAQAVSSITRQDYEDLYNNFQKLHKHIENSVIWTFARLPIELQESVVGKMMGYDADCRADDTNEEEKTLVEAQKRAIHIFMKTPLLHALDRWSRINQEQKSDVQQLFLRLNPYEYETEYTFFKFQRSVASDSLDSSVFFRRLDNSLMCGCLGGAMVGFFPGMVAMFASRYCCNMSSYGLGVMLAIPVEPAALGGLIGSLLCCMNYTYRHPDIAKALCTCKRDFKQYELTNDYDHEEGD